MDPLPWIALLLAALAGRSLLLQRLALRHGLLGTRGGRAWSVELRRRTCVCRVPGDLQAFPQPREFRIRVWRVAGVPLWWAGAYVSLPLHCDALVDALAPEVFDQLFDPAWRLDAMAAAVPPGPASRGAGRLPA